MAENNIINQNGLLTKMPVKLDDNNIIYNLLLKSINSDYLNNKDIILNKYLGHNIKITFLNKIYCVYCNRDIKKSFNSGYCFHCFRKLAECDSCIMSPEKCHYHLGTCRDPKWGDAHCMQSHYVYLANTSGLKVGVTRGKNIPTRWIDQGAISALPIFKVTKRYYAGLIEVIAKQHLNDKTHWQRMLANKVEDIDLITCRDDLYAKIEQEIIDLELKIKQDFPKDNLKNTKPIEYLNNNEFEVLNLSYPVLKYPEYKKICRLYG